MKTPRLTAKPEPSQASLAFTVVKPINQSSPDPHNPYATTLKIAIDHWPHHYNPADYDVYLIITTPMTTVREAATPNAQTLAGGEPFDERVMNRRLRALDLAPLSSFVPENFYNVIENLDGGNQEALGAIAQ